MPELLERRANETMSGSLATTEPARPDPSPERWRSFQYTVVREPTVRLSTALIPVVEQLAELQSLQPNWDSYGAPRVSETAINRALRLLADLQWTGPLPSIAPTARGGIHFEWGGDDEGVEMNIRADGTVTVLVDVAGHMREAEVQTLADPRLDPFLNEALSWAARLA